MRHTSRGSIRHRPLTADRRRVSPLHGTVVAVVSLLFPCVVAASPAHAVSFPTVSWPSSWTNPLQSGGSFTLTTKWGALSAGCKNADRTNGATYYLDSGTTAHTGIDMNRADGQVVVSIGAGQVVDNGQPWGSANGSVVTVQYATNVGETFVVVYGHLYTDVATLGTISAGQKIGRVRNAGTGAHLHLGVRPGAWNDVVPGGASASTVDGNGNCTFNSAGTLDPLSYLGARSQAPGNQVPRPILSVVPSFNASAPAPAGLLGEEDQTLSFSAMASTDPDGTVASVRWDFGDGSVATGHTTFHSWPVTGSFLVSLTVTDNLGATASTAVRITVETRPAALRLRNGDMAIFVRATDAALWETRLTPTGAQTPFRSLGGTGVASTAAAIELSDGIHLFVRGTDSYLYEQIESANGQLSGWINRGGGGVASTPTVFLDSTGRLLVTVRGTDQHAWIWSRSVNGAISWSDAGGGGVATASAIRELSPGVLELFAAATDRALWTRTWTAPNDSSRWRSLGGTGVASAPSVLTDHGFQTEVYVVGTDRHAWEIYRQAGASQWSSWTDWGGGGVIAGALSPVERSSTPRAVDLFTNATDSNGWSRSWTPTENFASWSSLGGGGVRSSVVAVRAADGSVLVLTKGSDRHLWSQVVRDGTSLGPWVDRSGGGLQ
jgi:hypothetical protein